MKNILVTGAAGALGSAVVEKFLAEGYRVIGTYYRSEPSEKRNVPNLEWLDMDVADPRSVHEGIASSTSKFGPIAGLVHCAGGFRFAKIDETSDADLDFLLHANLKSAILLVREVIGEMKRLNFGRIVLVSARSTQTPSAGVSVYTATKAGLNALTVAVADEVKSFNININSVLPTIIDTPMNRRDMPQANFNTWVKPAELATVIHGLVADYGNPVNGALIPVAGRL